jgi:hypothetical protein
METSHGIDSANSWPIRQRSDASRGGYSSRTLRGPLIIKAKMPPNLFKSHKIPATSGHKKRTNF